MNPAVSVVIPYFNNGAFLGEALESLSRQDYPLEIVLVDDGSDDDSVSRLPDVTYIRQENRGPAGARNTGIRAARGELIGFLDADDTWPDGKLAAQMARFAARPGLKMVTGRLRYIWDGIEPEPMRQAEDTPVHIHLGAALVRREAFARLGLFDESMPFEADLDWLLRFHEQGLPMEVTGEVALIYRRHAGNLSRGVDVRRTRLPEVLKRSLDRRRAAGAVNALPSLFGL